MRSRSSTIPVRCAPNAARAFIAPVGYLAYVLGDSNSHMAAVHALDDEEDEYFGDSIDIVIAEEAVAASHWLS